MLTLWRHYAARFSSAFLASFAILALLLVAVDAMLHFGGLIEETTSLGEAVRLLLQRCAVSYDDFLVPIAAFVAAYWCAGGATLHRETLALEASGIAPRVAFAPLLAVALALAGLQALALERVSVPAAAALAARRNPSGGDVQLQGGGAWFRAGRTVVWVGAEGARGDIRAVRVYERDAAGQLVRTLAAARALRLRPQTFELHDALVRELDPRAPGDPPRERREARVVVALASEHSPLLRRDELEGLPLAALRRHVAERRASGDGAGVARVVLHNRLSSPAAVFVFVLLAIPIALRSEGRRSLARGALQGAALVALYLVARNMGSTFAARSPELAVLFPWLTLGGLAALALALGRRTRV